MKRRQNQERAGLDAERGFRHSAGPHGSADRSALPRGARRRHVSRSATARAGFAAILLRRRHRTRPFFVKDRVALRFWVRLSGLEISDIAERDPGNLCERLAGEKYLMAGDDNVRKRGQALEDVILDDGRGSIGEKSGPSSSHPCQDDKLTRGATLHSPRRRTPDRNRARARRRFSLPLNLAPRKPSLVGRFRPLWIASRTVRAPHRRRRHTSPPARRPSSQRRRSSRRPPDEWRRPQARRGHGRRCSTRNGTAMAIAKAISSLALRRAHLSGAIDCLVQAGKAAHRSRRFASKPYHTGPALLAAAPENSRH